MALGSTFLDKFQGEAQAAKSLGQRDAWGVALGAAMSAGLPLFIQGASFPFVSKSANGSPHELGWNDIHPARTYELRTDASGLQLGLVQLDVRNRPS